MQAEDKDSGKFGKIKYSITGNKTEEYFKIDSSTGIIKTKKTLENVDENIPFKLTVTAKDNPNSTSDSHEVSAQLIINVIMQSNLLILVIGDAKPDVVSTKIDTITSVIEEQTGLIMGVDKLTSREYVGQNGTLEVDTAATDVWFYLIDPETDAVLTRNHSIVQR